MPKQVSVTFAGRTFTIKEQPMGAAAIWRKHLRESRVMLIFESLDTAMIQLVRVADGVDEGGWANVDMNQVIGIAKVLPVIVNGLSNSIDEIAEMLFAYAPGLKDDQEWILEHAYDTEAVAAFCEVLKLSFPFFQMLDLVRGQAGARTPTSLPLPNGAIGQRGSGRKQKI